MDHSFNSDARRQWVHPRHLEVWSRYPLREAPAGDRLHYQEAIPHLKRFTRRAQERGVTVALGTDTPFPHLTPGFSVHDELSLYVDAGTPPVEALRSATSLNARVLGLESQIGRIASGLVADLVAVRGNPLERIDDVSAVVAVMHRGYLLDRKTLFAAASASFSTELDDAITRDLLERIEAPPPNSLHA